METIFDHNPTERELNRFGGRESLEWGIARGMYKHDCNRLYHLGLLFAGRGDWEKANEYFNMIDERDSKILVTLMQDF